MEKKIKIQNNNYQRVFFRKNMVYHKSMKNEQLQFFFVFIKNGKPLFKTLCYLYQMNGLIDFLPKSDSYSFTKNTQFIIQIQILN